MDSKDLTREQAKALGDRIRPMLVYVGAVLERMTRRGFSPDDPLLDATSQAFGGLKDMHTLLHYLSCKGGVCLGDRE